MTERKIERDPRVTAAAFVFARLEQACHVRRPRRGGGPVIEAPAMPIAAFDAQGNAFEYAPIVDASDPGVRVTITDHADHSNTFELYGEGLLEFVAVCLRECARGLHGQPRGEVLSALRCLAPLLDVDGEPF